MKIIIIDYGSGNLRSVYNAFAFLGTKPLITDKASDLRKADKIVLPGVGAFKDAVAGLKRRGLIAPLKDHIKSGGVYLGMCLGMQILLEKSEEGPARGLGIFKGEVKRFRRKGGCKIPHMGWNTVTFSGGNAGGFTGGIKDGSYFYFVHSYYAEPEDSRIIAGRTRYSGVDFTSMLAQGNVFGTQFHPERSQGIGLKFIRNFIRL